MLAESDRHGCALGAAIALTLDWRTIRVLLDISALRLDLVQIGRAHVCTPVTNAHLVCRLLLEKKKYRRGCESFQTVTELHSRTQVGTQTNNRNSVFNSIVYTN